MKEQISIIGCGWLGLPLAKKLNDLSCKVKGTTTSKSKLKTLLVYDIKAYHIILNENEVKGNLEGFLEGSRVLIINIPPGLRANKDKNHVAEIKNLIKKIEKSKIENVIFISSTSVFKDEEHFPVIKKNSTVPNNTSNSAKQLIEIERLLQSNLNFKTTILRFGGLFGEDRHPATYLSGRNNISNPEAPINLIHQQDCIAIIISILKNKLWNKTLNASYPNHPNKKTYYTNYCKLHNLDLPYFNKKEKSKGKIIDSSELVQLLNYTFKQAP